MFDSLASPLTFIAALGSGLIAGTFFAFSNFVMGALGRLPAPQGIAAMQSINVVVMNPVFLGIFTGTALVAALLAVLVFFNWSSPGAYYLIGGALLYVVGTFFVTVVGNVPLNDALMAVGADSAEGPAFWSDYLKNWVFWNHVRTVAALGATGAYILALRA